MVLTVAVLFIGPLLYGIYIDRKSRNRKASFNGTAVFKISKWFLLICYAEIAMSLFIIILGFRQGFAGVLYVGLIGIFLLVLGVACIYYMARTYVEINEQELIYCDGLQNTRIPLNNITQVFMVSGLLTIAAGLPHRLLIPLIFAKSWELIALLRANCNIKILQDSLNHGLGNPSSLILSTKEKGS
jgi:hypothetical protein